MTPPTYITETTLTDSGVNFVVLKRDGIGALVKVAEGSWPTLRDVMITVGAKILADVQAGGVK